MSRARCKFCDKVIRPMSELLDHELTCPERTNVTPDFTCSICGKECKNAFELQRHKWKHREVDTQMKVKQ